MAECNIVCNFCRQGDEEALELCGKLHVEKINNGEVVAAHHKCMQYSAGLIQYKFDHFGGFKIDKVQAELRRGKQISCRICKKDRKRKGKATRATSGCAVKTCRKSFHYYCAKKSDTCITKRMLVRFKKSDEQRVLYRVFCCHDHEDYFKAHKEDLIQNDSTAGSSDSDLDDPSDAENEKTTGNGYNFQNDESDQNSELDRTDVMMTTLCSPEEDKLNLQYNKENSSNTDDMEIESEPVSQQNSADWQPEIVKIKSLNNGEKRPKPGVFTKLFPDTESDPNQGKNKTSPLLLNSPTNNGNVIRLNRRDYNILEDGNRKSPRKKIDLQVTEGMNRKSTDRTPEGSRKSVPSENEGSLSSHDESRCSSSTEKCYPDCVLVITNAMPCLKRTKLDIIKKIGASSKVVFWSKEEDVQGLRQEHLPHLMNDIVGHLSDNNMTALIQLLTDNSHLASRLLILNYALNLHKKLETKMTNILLESLMTSIADCVKKINDKQMCQFFTSKDGTSALAISVNNKLDPNYDLRSTLDIEEMSKCCLHMLTGKLPQFNVEADSQQGEAMKLTCWIDITFEGQPKVLTYPEEKFLLDNSVHSVSNDVALQLCNRAKDDKRTPSTVERETNVGTTVVCIRRMDTSIVNYKNFCHKCIRSYLSTKQPVVVILDIVNGEFKNVDDLVPMEVKDSYTVEAYTASEPTGGSMMSAVLLHFSPQRKSSRKSKDQKSPATSRRSGEVLENGLKSQTSKKRYRHDSSSDNSSEMLSSSKLSEIDKPSSSSKKKRTT